MDSAERTGCQKYDLPVGSPSAGALHDDVAAGTLPTLGLLIPDLCNDGHDCSAGTADAWLRGWLPQVKAGLDYRSGHLTIVVTFDEDDKTSGNRVMTVVIHPSLHGRQVTTRLDHYSLSASISRLAGAQPLRNAANAPDLLAAFSL
jgi:hypothetical protein